MAQHHVTLHLRTPQIQESVLETDVLIRVAAIQLEGEHGGAVQDAEARGIHLNLTRRQVRVCCVDFLSLEAADNLARYLNNALYPQRLRLLGQISIILRVKNNLGLAGAVTEVDEDHPAVVAYCVHPTDKGHFLAHVSQAELIACVRTVLFHNIKELNRHARPG